MQEETVQSEASVDVTHRAQFPDWFTKGWSRTATAGQREVFVGDRPLFPACHSTAMASAMADFIEPRRYLSSSKNPCWYEDSGKEKALRCLPYFYVAGMAQCGASDLYRRLRIHSQVMRGTMKEYHYWDRQRFGSVDINDKGQVIRVHKKPWSLKKYAHRVAGDRDLTLITDDLKYSGSSSKIFGDGSASYLSDAQNWPQLAGNQGCKEPRQIVGQHMRHVFPQARVIILMRHPTPRLYTRFLSGVWRTAVMQAPADVFHSHVVRGVRQYRDCFQRWSIRHCAYNHSLSADVPVRLVEGMYPVFLADWLRVWPREQLLLLRTEDYGTNLTAILDSVFRFLGVGEPTEDEWQAMSTQSKVSLGVGDDKGVPMRPETASILDEFYQPFIRQLADMLQDSSFLWSDVYTPSTSIGADSGTSGPGSQSGAQGKEASFASGQSDPKSASAASTDKPLPLWAKLLMQFKPDSWSSESKSSHQIEEAPIMRINKPSGPPIKKARYPAWFVSGWPKSSTSGLGDQFLGDQPFFAPCTSHPAQPHSHLYRMLEPRHYEEEATLKNPCWYREREDAESSTISSEGNSGLRCVPYFYVAGVAKSGAGDLYRRLLHHPHVTRGGVREFHWWDRGRFGDVYTDDLPIKAARPAGMRIPFKQYTDMVTGRQGMAAVLQDLNKTGKSSRIFGDVSPSYFNDVKLWPLLDGNQGCNEPRVTIAQHIRHMTPNAKIIVLVRHPTPRAYLRFMARVPEKVSVRKAASFAFHRLVKKSVNMYRACFDRWSVRHCAYNTTLYLKDKVKLWEGMYSVFLWDWLRVFPRKQIFVARYRDLIRETRSVMEQIFHFLELPPLNETQMRAVTAEKWLERREEHELKKYFGSMVPETVDMLNDFYEPFVDKFAETLNDERFLWRDSDHL